MAYSYVEYPGNGIAKDFTVTFPYLSTTHVKCYLNSVETALWSWLNSTTIRMNVAPPPGQTLRIKRITPRDARLVDFQDAAVLTEAILDLSADQQFYLTQEAYDESQQEFVDAFMADVQAAKVIAEAASTAAVHAQADAEHAQADAEHAQADSETAQAASEAARDASIVAKNASEAARDLTLGYRDAAALSKTAAETAETNAEAAEANALIYRNAAQAAKTAAETAETNAETAQGLAEGARDAAITAKNAAEHAQGDAETAQAAAEHAQADAEAAQAAAEAVAAGLATANESQAGILEVATQVEANGRTLDDKIITPLKLAKFNGFNRKNLLINGTMQVAQRLDQTIGVAYGASRCDRWGHFFTSGSGAPSGSSSQADSDGASARKTLYMGSLTCAVTNTLYVYQRCEARVGNAIRYALTQGKKLSLQFKIYHNFGVGANVSAQIATANVLETFGGAETTRWGSGVIASVPNGSFTTYKVEGFAPTNTDFEKGFVLYIPVATPIMTNKTVIITDVQLEIGDACSELEILPYPMELMLCQRYYSKGTTFFDGDVSNGGTYYVKKYHPVTMRTTPQISLTTVANGAGFPASASTYDSGDGDGYTCYRACSGSGTSFFGDSYTANAEL